MLSFMYLPYIWSSNMLQARRFRNVISKFTRSRFYLLFTCMPWQHSAFLTDFTALNGFLCYIAPEISILISSHIFNVFEFQGHPWLTVTGEFKQEFILVKQELAVGRMWPFRTWQKKNVYFFSCIYLKYWVV